MAIVTVGGVFWLTLEKNEKVRGENLFLLRRMLPLIMLIDGMEYILQYLAKLSNKSKLFGDDGSLEQEVRVLSWMSWANQELLPTLALW